MGVFYESVKKTVCISFILMFLLISCDNNIFFKNEGILKLHFENNIKRSIIEPDNFSSYIDIVRYEIKFIQGEKNR